MLIREEASNTHMLICPQKKSPSFVYHMEDMGNIRSYPKYYTGWWYTYPSEK